MGQREVEHLIGVPTDTHQYVTPKGAIPFYGGSDVNETVYHYPGVGRVVFASGPGNPNWHVIRVEADPTESGFFRATPGAPRVPTGAASR